ncbi:flagellar hook-associated protein 3 [Bordetella genomosp. 11]|uniref:Flagellar hook-associated protein 3 n=1 Tax=Bordetella genomosp. 11 TaxID=1416808 RepID=A0A261UN75_9BORD|nr:flagellar hook-associated protein FlgL [Bordetella genomosp. 11]OZI63319.1 flagellar hook-associated protein 3 [Bordetella genomosp. 11]
MRLSTSTIYQSGLNGILKNESDVNYLQQQLSSGRSVVTPSDNPLAAGQAITAYQNLNITQTYGSNRDAANRSLGNESNTLSTVVSTLTDVLTRVVQAGNGTLADQDRNTLATVLEQSRDALFALANTTDGNGQYLFSGTAGNAAAYVKDPVTGAITYNGNSGQRLVQVEQSRQMNVSDVGSDIFNRVSPGTTTYIASAGAANAGTATFAAPSIAPGGGSGNNFQIDFAKDPTTGAVTYTVTTTDASTGTTTTSAPAAFNPGDAIDTGGGVTMVVNGDPADGDSFTINTAQTSNVDMFATLGSLITALKDPAQNDQAAQSKLVNLLATANKSLSINLDNVSTVQASVGARQNELDALDTTGTQRSLTDNQTLTDLTQINYYDVISKMSMRQLSLQASMSAFSAVKGTSLFSMNK